MLVVCCVLFLVKKGVFWVFGGWSSLFSVCCVTFLMCRVQSLLVECCLVYWCLVIRCWCALCVVCWLFVVDCYSLWVVC